ncbi:MAG: clostripain-related cysteine peptidase [Caldilineaceae bacterium]
MTITAIYAGQAYTQTFMAPGVQVVVLRDGPLPNDSRIFSLNENDEWQDAPLTVTGLGSVEADMGSEETLAHFASWAIDTYAADYRALFMLGPANGVVGFGEDRHGAHAQPDLLTPADLRTALERVAAQNTRKLDLLYLDGGPFGLLEDAAIVEGMVNFVVAAPNTRFALYDYARYRHLASQSTAPGAYALALAQTDATRHHARGLPYALAVWDMAYFEPLRLAVDELGKALQAYVQTGPEQRAQLERIRRQIQHYDGGGQTVNAPDPEDPYVDLVHLATTLTMTHTNAGVAESAQQVIGSMADFVVEHYVENGQFQSGGQMQCVDLTHAHGVGIYYPPSARAESGTANARYLNHELFHISPGWGWTDFIFMDNGSGLPFPGEPSPMADDFLLMPVLVNGAADSTVHIFLPLAQR